MDKLASFYTRIVSRCLYCCCRLAGRGGQAFFFEDSLDPFGVDVHPDVQLFDQQPQLNVSRGVLRIRVLFFFFLQIFLYFFQVIKIISKKDPKTKFLANVLPKKQI